MNEEKELLITGRYFAVSVENEDEYFTVVYNTKYSPSEFQKIDRKVQSITVNGVYTVLGIRHKEDPIKKKVLFELFNN